jgi:hypothetical protein
MEYRDCLNPDQKEKRGRGQETEMDVDQALQWGVGGKEGIMITHNKQALASSIFGNTIGVSSRTNRKANKSHAESYPDVKQALPQPQAHFILRSE